MKAFIAVLVCLLLGICLVLAPSVSFVPFHLRFFLGTLCFGWAPGYLAYGWLQRRSRESADPIELLLSVVSLSFSTNLFFNVVLFASGLSFHNLTIAMLLLIAALYVFTLVANRMAIPELSNIQFSGGLLFKIVLALTVVALVPLYFAGSPPVNLEELVSLRKLAENPHVHFDNLSFNKGDPVTYLLLPFQIFIVGVSTVARIDVAEVYSMFWFVSSFLAIACIVDLMKTLNPGTAALCACLIVAMGLLIFAPNSTIYDAGILNPYPNRYGFAGGVLLPLNLLIFLNILKNRVFDIRLAFLLVYLIFEMTFVHARETLFVLGFVILSGIILLFDFRRFGHELKRIGAILLTTITILILYKHVNLTLAPSLGDFVAKLSGLARLEVSKMLATKGFWESLLSFGPNRVIHQWTETSQTEIVAPGFLEIFVYSWLKSPHFWPRLFLPFSFLVLPFYLWRTRSLIDLIFSGLLIFAALTLASGLIKFSIASIVGNPEVLLAYNIVFICSLLVFLDTCVRFGNALNQRLAFFPIFSRVWAQVVGFVLQWIVCLGGLLGFGMLLSQLPQVTIQFIATSCFAVSAVVFVIVIAKRTKTLPIFRTGDLKDDSNSRWGWALAPVFSFVSLIALHSETFLRNHFEPIYKSPVLSGQILEDYSALNAQGKVPQLNLPISIVRFLREELPANRTLLSQDSLALATLTNHYFGIITVGTSVPASYIINAKYLSHYATAGSSVFQWRDHLQSADSFAAILNDYKPAYVVLENSEGELLSKIVDAPLVRELNISEVFKEKDFQVIRIGRFSGVN